LLNDLPADKDLDSSVKTTLSQVDPETERVIEEMFRRLLGNPDLKIAHYVEASQPVTEVSEAVTETPAVEGKPEEIAQPPQAEEVQLAAEPAQPLTLKVRAEELTIRATKATPAPAAEEILKAEPVLTTQPTLAQEKPTLSLFEGARLLGLVLLASLPVLAIATVLRLWDLSQSQQSAYMDEASYIVTGRLLLEQGKVYANALQWTFGSFLYPVLAGWLDQQGGLILARSLSLVSNLVTVLAVIFLTLGLFKNVPKSQPQARADFALGSKPVMAALIAGLLVAVLPTAIALSQFATYDALAAGLFACGGAAFVWGRRQIELAEQTGTKRTVLVLSLFGLAALCLFAAFLTKYVVAMYFPALCLLLLSVKQERRYGLWSFIAPLSAACLAYYLLFSTDLSALLHFGGQYQTLRSNDWLHEYVLNRPELLVLALVGYWGLRQAFRDGRISQALLLWGGVVLLVIFQLITRADYDYWKHSIYLIILLAPLAGWLWSDWSWWDEPGAHAPGRVRRWWESLKERHATDPRRLSGLLNFERHVAGDEATERPGSYSLWFTLATGLVLLGFLWSQSQALSLVKHWPSLTPALPQLEEASQNVNTILTDDSALIYYLYQRIPTDNITTPFFINYKGKSGVEAYLQAVRDQQYDLVVLDGGATQEGKNLWDKLHPALQASSAYELTFSTPLDSTNLSEKHSLEIYRLLTPEEQKDPNRAKKPVVTTTTSPSNGEAKTAATPVGGAGTTPENKPTAPATTAAPVTTAVAATTAVPSTNAAPTTPATATVKPTATVPPAPVYPAKAAYNFSNGDEGWGALPPNGGSLEPGMAVTSSEAYLLDGHPSLKFTPQLANKVYTVGVNRTGEVKKISLYVYVPADKAGGEVRVGMYYFDQKWGWHDDGFQTKVVPGQWTQLTLELPAAQSIQQFGMKLVGFSGAIYLNGVVVE
jgi:hypothetical protein